jgi:hypothetical protein
MLLAALINVECRAFERHGTANDGVCENERVQPV